MTSCTTAPHASAGSTTPTPPSAPHARLPGTRAVIAFYVGLTPARVADVAAVYTEEARFIDPFNDVQGHAALRTVFLHMFTTVEAPRFEVLDAIEDGDGAVLLWDFHFGRGTRARRVHGASHLRFAADGRVAWHRDYWDPARELYEHVPLLGWLMRRLRRRLSATAG